MQRLNALDPNLATGRRKELLDAVDTTFGMVPNLFRTTAVSTPALEGMLGLFSALGKGSLSGRLRELIALAVSQKNKCTYCLSAHTAIAGGAGVDAAAIAAARRARSADLKEEAALKFAAAIVEKHGQVTDGDMETVRSAGWGESDIVEITANVVFTIFTNYVNSVADTDVDFPVVSVAAA